MADNICVDCGYEGPEGPGEDRCPVCGGEMVSAEDIDDEDSDGEELDGEELEEKEPGDEEDEEEI